MTIAVIVAFTAAVGLSACSQSNTSNSTGEGWSPSETVRVIVPYDAGGGTDIAFRQLTEIINSDKLSDVRWVVENKEGGSGTTGMRYVASQGGNESVLMATTPGHISIPILQNLDVSIKDLTPVANTIIDPQVLFAYEGSGLTSAEQIVTKLTDAPESLSIAGAPIGQDDHLSTLVFEGATNTTFNYVPFSGGDEVKTNILGGQVDVAWLNPGEAEGQRVDQGGPLVPIAVALEDRLEGSLDGVPTFVEGGYDVVYEMFFRGVTAPPDVSEASVDYYADVIKKATETEDWQEFVAQAQAKPFYLSPPEFAESLAAWTDTVNSLIAEQ
ncbi:tripartite tricarboxylate transporter substrate binding protein [Mycolicibacterium sp. XJ870]